MEQESWTNDRDAVMKAVRLRGLELEDASEELRGDREIVWAAVCSDWRALYHASEELRGVVER